jgi:uncharacterized protein (TIGR03435 family)
MNSITSRMNAVHASPGFLVNVHRTETFGVNVMRTTPFLTLITLLLPLLSSAQPQTTFDAASIKPNREGGGPYPRVLPGRLLMTYYSVQELVAFAYGLRTEQVVGQFPSDRYDIEAKTDGPVPMKQMTGPMLQALLAERFALRLHRETRDLPIYNLSVAKSGAKMPPTKHNCVVSNYDSGATPPPADGQSADPVFYCDHPSFAAQGVNRTVEGKGITMKALAESLSRTELNRTVMDKTGLTGAFDVTLKWVADPSSPAYDGFGGPAPAQSGAGPSLFAALQEQLGLRVQAGRGPVDVLVIDRVEKPTP